MPPEAPTIALPPTVLRALDGIARDLTDMPRACARDREEMIFWHARLARRLRAVLTMRVPVPDLGEMPKNAGEKSTGGVLRSEATPKPTRHPRRASRTIRARNGRQVRVEIRQLEMTL